MQKKLLKLKKKFFNNTTHVRYAYNIKIPWFINFKFTLFFVDKNVVFVTNLCMLARQRFYRLCHLVATITQFLNSLCCLWYVSVQDGLSPQCMQRNSAIAGFHMTSLKFKLKKNFFNHFFLLHCTQLFIQLSLQYVTTSPNTINRT